MFFSSSSDLSIIPEPEALVAAQRVGATSQRNLQWWIFHSHEEPTQARESDAIHNRLAALKP
jgi:hypothetical protein